MKRNLWICVALLVVASWLPQLREPPAPKGFSIQGVGLHCPDEEVEALVGRELPGSLCPQEGNHQHRYRDGLRVYFDETFSARTISGSSLELDGKVVVQAGDAVESISEPFLTEILLEDGARLVARPVPESYLDEDQEFGWKPVLTKGYDQAFRVAYRYQSDDGRVTDFHDFDLHILALSGYVQRVVLVWKGH